MDIQNMMDAEGVNSGHIPMTTPFVGAYVSGTGGVPWNAAELSRFPAARTVRIYQGAGTYPGVSGYDFMDVETHAVTPAQCASEFGKRCIAGIEYTGIYATRDNLTACVAAIEALPANEKAGFVYAWLADWNLSEVSANALLGTNISGAVIVAVQWASPSSNPHTLVPGTEDTLSQLNIDLSVIDADAFPFPVKTPPPPPPPGVTMSGLVVWESINAPFQSREVTSTDNGKTWA